jgi:hypothetical protein
MTARRESLSRYGLLLPAEAAGTDVGAAGKGRLMRALVTILLLGLTLSFVQGPFAWQVVTSLREILYTSRWTPRAYIFLMPQTANGCACPEASAAAHISSQLLLT